MKPHRVFIAINLPGKAREELLAYKEKWPELPARWTTKENLHLTLAFLGNTSDQELAEVCRLIQKVSARHKPFSINISHITYGPKQNNPRMIWALGEESSELLALQKDIEQTLEHRDNKPFSPHLTLARLKTFQLQRMEPEEIPQIDEEISLSFEVNSIEVMESQLKRSGAEYSVCQSFPLNKNS